MVAAEEATLARAVMTRIRVRDSMITEPETKCGNFDANGDMNNLEPFKL